MKALRPALAAALAALALAPLAALALASRPALAAAPPIETHVRDTRVAMGEPLALQIRLRGAATASEPDLSPLSSDFEVLDVQRSHRTQIVNGVSDTSVDYIVELFPRRVGSLVIPALPIGDLQSEPVAIEVAARADGTDALHAPDAAANPVQIEVHADRSDPYEHERVLLRVQLYYGSDVLEGALGTPEVPGALVEPVGEERRFEKEIDGRTWNGIERSYTVLPESSGALVVGPIRFDGRVRAPQPAPRARRFGGFFGGRFDDFFADMPTPEDLLSGMLGGGSRRIAVESQPLTLTVRPRPAAAEGQWWLPARDVALSERWEPATEARVGEPITRQIALRADGVSPAQLPALASADVEGVKQYAEAPTTKENEQGTVRVDATTFIPTRAGKVTLPAVEVAWWDTSADAPRSASLPARTLDVLPALASGDARAGASPAPAPAAAVAAPEGSAPAISATAPGDAAQPWGPRAWGALIGAATLTAFLLGVGLARRMRSAAPGASPPTRRSAERTLRRACRRSDPAAAEAALRALEGIHAAPRPDAPAFAEEVARLKALRYSTESGVWDGAALWRAWRRARKLRRPPVSVAALPPLYPAPPETTRG